MSLFLYNACRKGDKNKILELIEKGANDWNFGLRGACFRGHKEIILMMIEKGATEIHYYVKYPKNKSILIYLIQKGVTRDKMKEVRNIEKLYGKLGEINKVMKYIMPKELIQIVEEYIQIFG